MKKSLKVFSLILFLTFIIFIIVELLVRNYLLTPLEEKYKRTIKCRSRVVPGSKFEDRERYVMEDDINGYLLVPDLECYEKSIEKKTKELIFQGYFSTDMYSLRLTPKDFPERRRKFAIFFGATNTFGQGAGDKETIPYLFQKCGTDYQGYNYASPRNGTQHILARLEEKRIPKELKQQKGIAFYNYLSSHIHRVIGSGGFLRWGDPEDYPYYYLDSNNKLIRNGNLLTGKSLSIFINKALLNIHLFRYFDLFYPPVLSKNNYELVCRIIFEARKSFEDQFPGSKFVVVVGPGSKSDDPIVETCLKKYSMLHFDYRDLVPSEFDIKWRFKDWHYRSSLNKLFAETLCKDVKKHISF